MSDLSEPHRPTQPLTELPDDHRAWRLIGQWIAIRQLGQPERVAALSVADPVARQRVVADAKRLAAAPLRTGSGIDVTARGRIGEGEIRDVRLTLIGHVEGGDPVENRLSFARIVEDAEGEWKLAELLTAQDRSLFEDPSFQRFMSGAELVAPEDGTSDDPTVLDRG